MCARFSAALQPPHSHQENANKKLCTVQLVHGRKWNSTPAVDIMTQWGTDGRSKQRQNTWKKQHESFLALFIFSSGASTIRFIRHCSRSAHNLCFFPSLPECMLVANQLFAVYICSTRVPHHRFMSSDDDSHHAVWPKFIHRWPGETAHSCA